MLSYDVKAPYPKLEYNNKPTETIVYVDAAFTEEEETVISNALKSVECSTNHLFRYKIYFHTLHDQYLYADTSKSVFIWKVDHTDQHIVENDKIMPIENGSKLITIGLFHKGNKEHSSVIFIVYDRIYGNDSLWSIITHEILHYHGIPHTKNEKSIMYHKTSEDSMLISSFDVDIIAKTYYFDLSSMKVCNIK